MLDSNDLLMLIKRAAMEANEASQPSDFCFGKVTSTSPLKILVEQKMTLGSAQLILTRNVTDYESKIEIDWVTDTSSAHQHTLKGVHTVKFKNALVVGDEVVLLKRKGGQQYLVLDRVVKK